MSSEDVWEDASSDEDYQYQEEEDTEADSAEGSMDDGDVDENDDADPSPFLNPGLAHHLLQQFSGTGLFATLNEAFGAWDNFDPDEEDYGIDELIHVGASARTSYSQDNPVAWLTTVVCRCRVRIRCWRASRKRGSA